MRHISDIIEPKRGYPGHKLREVCSTAQGHKKHGPRCETAHEGACVRPDGGPGQGIFFGRREDDQGYAYVEKRNG